MTEGRAALIPVTHTPPHTHTLRMRPPGRAGALCPPHHPAAIPSGRGPAPHNPPRVRARAVGVLRGGRARRGRARSGTRFPPLPSPPAPQALNGRPLRERGRGLRGGGAGAGYAGPVRGMLSRKKTRTELSKPGEVQGKYVKKETSPLLRSECQGAGGRVSVL